MIATDKDALMCDLAETYGIFNYKELPASRVALFACGLRDDSRIKQRMRQDTYPLNTMLLAAIADRLSLLLWTKTKAAQKGRGKPALLIERMIKSKSDIVAFSSSASFEQTRAKILKGGYHGD